MQGKLELNHRARHLGKKKQISNVRPNS